VRQASSHSFKGTVGIGFSALGEPFTAGIAEAGD